MPGKPPVKRVMTSGSSSGIGLELSKQLLNRGTEVIGSPRYKNNILKDHEFYKHIALDLSCLEKAVSSGDLTEGLSCDGVFPNAGTFGDLPITVIKFGLTIL